MSETTLSPTQIRTRFLIGRLGSILAILPLGVWTFFHLLANLSAADGAAAWEAKVTGYSSPFAVWIAFAAVIIPLVWHAIWGLIRLKTARPNNLHYGYWGNLKYLLQRLAGIGVLFFLGAHIWLAFLYPRVVLGHPETFADIASQMRFHGPTLAVYLLGTLGVSYHLATGFWSFCFGLGLAPRSVGGRFLDILSVALFVLMLGMSWAVIYFMWSQGQPPVPA